MTKCIYVQFEETNAGSTIRRWQTTPFAGGQEYVRAETEAERKVRFAAAEQRIRDEIASRRIPTTPSTGGA